MNCSFISDINFVASVIENLLHKDSLNFIVSYTITLICKFHLFVEIVEKIRCSAFSKLFFTFCLTSINLNYTKNLFTRHLQQKMTMKKMWTLRYRGGCYLVFSFYCLDNITNFFRKILDLRFLRISSFGMSSRPFDYFFKMSVYLCKIKILGKRNLKSNAFIKRF